MNFPGDISPLKASQVAFQQNLGRPLNDPASLKQADHQHNQRKD
jgi:hypothetical protein